MRKRKGKFEWEIEDCQEKDCLEKEKKCLHCTVWVFVCIIPAWLLFLWWMSQWEIFFCIFWQKREWVNCFRFSSTYFFFAASSLSVGLASLTIFLLFISLSVSWIDSSGMLGSIEKLILIIFPINEFLQKTTQFQRNNLSLSSNETTLWFIFQIVEDRLLLIHNWSLDIADLQRQVGSVALLFHLLTHLRHRDISHSLKSRVPFPSRQPVLNKSLNSLRQPTCLDKFLSS